MKKILFGVTALLAVVAFMAAPAAAELKLTSSGYMQVQGLLLNGNPSDGSSRTNDWYNMKMIVDPVLHINDKVRIFSEVYIMQRNYSGTAKGDLYATDAAQHKFSVFGDEQNNFWVNRLYMNLRLFNGDFRVGRMSGGNWAHPFNDLDQDRDRVLYIGRPFGGDITWVVLPIEKRDERDGGQVAPRVGSFANNQWKASDNDQDAYALGFVIPIGKMILFRPLWYGIRDGQNNLIYPGNSPSPNWTNILLNGLDFTFGNFKINSEIDYGWSKAENVEGGGGREKDIDWSQWAIWADASFTTGPFEIAVGGFWIQGDDNQRSDPNDADNDRVGPLLSTGTVYEPSLIMFSEDMGLFYNSTGVPNGSFGSSGYQSFIVRGGYKLTDTMKFTAVYEYLKADQMERTTVYKNGQPVSGTPDDALGSEVDLTFAWKFMPNVTYLVTGGYFWAGDWFKDVYGDNNDVIGVRNTIRVEW